MNKRIITSCLIIFFIIIIICLPYWINDIACLIYKNQIKNKLAEISELNVIEILNACGNSSGTGNHTDLYVAVLVETSLSETDIKNSISEVCYVHEAEKNSLAMRIMNLSFKLKSNRKSYILEFKKLSPCSFFDFRGH